jgi:hypothetical protein
MAHGYAGPPSGGLVTSKMRRTGWQFNSKIENFRRFLSRVGSFEMTEGNALPMDNEEPLLRGIKLLVPYRE